MMMEFESALGLEVDMAWKFHSPIWAAVRSARVLATFVVGMGVVVLFVTGDGVDAFDAETLHFVDGAFGGGLHHGAGDADGGADHRTRGGRREAAGQAEGCERETGGAERELGRHLKSP